jgi:hypothetical protein
MIDFAVSVGVRAPHEAVADETNIKFFSHFRNSLL